MFDRVRRTARPEPAREEVSIAPGVRACLAALLAVFACLGAAASATAAQRPFLDFKHNTTVASTVPANGDLNPYGVVVAPATTGSLVAGNVLVSNFNSSENLQGTGTTIVQITPRGHVSVFAQISPSVLPGPCPGGVGLTTALAVLPQGFVVVGSLPTTNGSAETAQAGCLIVLNSNGTPVETIAGGPINGPWDMTAVNEGQQQHAVRRQRAERNRRHGETPVDEGTVVRIRVHVGMHSMPAVKAMDVIAEGFPERTDEAALVIGPTGVGLGDDGTLYVADTLGNRIAAVRNAIGRHAPVTGAGATVAQGRLSQQPPRPRDRAQRRHPHRERGRREHRRDHAGRRGVPAVRHRCRRRRSFRPRRHARPERPLLRERLRKLARPAALRADRPTRPRTREGFAYTGVSATGTPGQP